MPDLISRKCFLNVMNSYIWVFLYKDSNQNYIEHQPNSILSPYYDYFYYVKIFAIFYVHSAFISSYEIDFLFRKGGF